MKKADVRIITFDPEHIDAFVTLNRQWIEAHFRLEPADMRQLNDPGSTILVPGGEIFFVVDESGRALGTCAMVPHGSLPDGAPVFELAKMAVAPEARGKGYGDLLMKASIDWAKARGAGAILILSNTILEPAITLYLKHGFQVTRLGPNPDYERCNIEMMLALKA